MSIDFTLGKNFLWHELKSQALPVVIYGMGNGGEKIFRTCQKYNITVSGIFASDDFVRGQSFLGFTVKTYQTLVDELGDFVILQGFAAFTPELLGRIKWLAQRHKVYSPDFSLFSDDHPTPEFFAANRGAIDAAYSLLSDERSKEVFRNLISYKLTGDIAFLLSSHDSPSSPFTSFFKLGGGERYLDLGAYRGDTIESFLDATDGRFESILAFEPDPRNFTKLAEYTASINGDITLYEAAVADKCGTAFFTGKGGRASHISDEGYEVETVRLDDIPYRPTYIKMDVEGAETAAINGARAMISRNKPKLQISIYHQIDDFFNIPNLIHQINPNYKIYIRMFPYIPAWDVMMYAVEE